ncbi:MAG: glycerol-3-phosphate 1-O-acyltransferase PlsY [bacterium]|jgi:glycerol-3-phosphate acyltransferase PlsY
MGELILTGVIAYLLGSIPIGVIVSKFWGRDIREHGSKNIGTTNALRVLGPLAALITLVGDVVKGTVGVLLGMYICSTMWGMAVGAVAAVFGHTYPLYLQFKGGKGIATAFGAAIILAPSLGLSLAVIWIVVILLTRYVSLGSIVAAASAPLLVYILSLPAELYLFAFLVGGNSIIRHHSNIKRLLAGKEYKIGQRV